MHHIVYMSSVVGTMSEEELRELLLESRANNTRRHITGVLLFSDGHVMQVLEGDEQEVMALYQVIERDFRHRALLKLSDGEIPQRAFPDWSMGFTTTSPHNFERLVGYFNPRQPNSLTTQPGNEVFELLKEFCADKNQLL